MFGNYNKKFRTKLLKRDKNIKRKIRKWQNKYLKMKGAEITK